MLRLASHQLVRASARSIQPAARVAGRRFASSGAAKPRSWKSLMARLGLAGGAVYLYNTNSAFSEQAEYAVAPHSVAASLTQPEQPITEKLPTLEEIAAERRKRAAAAEEATKKAEQEADSARTSAEGSAVPAEAGVGGVEGLEEEAAQQGAFNEETGEINWDCPCLGGMADGPCGPQFKEAFSCFVFSKEEPKGVDCIDKFKNMQDCFRLYPDIYGAELEDDEDMEGSDVDTENGAAEAKRAAEARSEAEPDTPSGPNPSKKGSDVLGNDVAAKGTPTEVIKPSQDASIASTDNKPATADDGEKSKGAEQAIPKEWHDESDVKPAAKK